MRQRGLQRRSSAIGTNEGVIDGLCQKLQLAAIKKGQRNARPLDGVSLPSGISIERGGISITSRARTGPSVSECP